MFSSTESTGDCVELIISHNTALKSIKNSFERVPKLCRLDLSYNNLQSINHNWMNWSALSEGVNLQGNPIDCTCKSQWLLDYFIPMLYQHKESQPYLLELRCASPGAFKGHRLIRYMNHTNAFCQPEVKQFTENLQIEFHMSISIFFRLHIQNSVSINICLEETTKIMGCCGIEV